MRQISDLLEKFKKFKNPKDNLRTISKIIEETTGVTLEPETIAVRNKKIILAIIPLEKTEILFRKDVILDKIKDQIKDLVVEDII